jgi:hypothetical protein
MAEGIKDKIVVGERAARFAPRLVADRASDKQEGFAQ